MIWRTYNVGRRERGRGQQAGPERQDAHTLAVTQRLSQGARRQCNPIVTFLSGQGPPLFTNKSLGVFLAHQNQTGVSLQKANILDFLWSFQLEYCIHFNMNMLRNMLIILKPFSQFLVCLVWCNSSRFLTVSKYSSPWSWFRTLVLHSSPSSVNINSLARQDLTMTAPQHTENRLFTGTLPSLDLSTILLVFIVQAAFLLGMTPPHKPTSFDSSRTYIKGSSKWSLPPTCPLDTWRLLQPGALPCQGRREDGKYIWFLPRLLRLHSAL